MPLGSSENLEQFLLGESLGAGGMGEVFEATDTRTGRRVALKLLPALAPDALLRFKNEFRVLSELEHENIVRVGELRQSEGRWFYTMELIEGVDFQSWVQAASPADVLVSHATFDLEDLPRSGNAAGRSDEARLRSALAQLLDGLRAVHGAGLVHRDIKPDNVLVTPAGRVVLLDFGVAHDPDSRHTMTGGAIIGTPAYMAPEQAAGVPAGQAADLYAVGVMLYQALTGLLPIDGKPLDIVTRKQFEVPKPPSERARGVPKDLAALCMALLAIDPAARPTVPTAGVHTPRPSPPRLEFVGRRPEREFLARAFTDARNGIGARSVLVHGPAGVGKSALVAAIARELVADDPRTVVLSGRCYERESVPFKAFDGIIDDLSRWMARLPPQEAGAMLPRAAALLGDIFPVMRRLPSGARAPATLEPEADARRRRLALFAAIRELLARAADRFPLLLVIDDVQWGDADSMALLGAVVAAPDPPRLLIVATSREAVIAHLPNDIRQKAVGALSTDDASALAARLLASHGLADDAASSMATEAGGHPLFLAALVHHAVHGGTGTPDLEQALWTRFEALAPRARAVSAAGLLAGVPLDRRVLGDVVQLAPDEVDEALVMPIAHRLLRTRGSSVEPYHDRVRESVANRLSQHERVPLHRALAESLGQAGGHDENVAHHWLAVGDKDHAVTWLGRAAAAAEAALAFERAASIYRRCLEVYPAHDHRSAWQHGLAHALVHAGHRREGARLLLALSLTVPDALAALTLKRDALAHLMQNGDVEDAQALLPGLLGDLGARLPRRAITGWIEVVVRTIRERLRRHRPAPGSSDPQRLLLLDLYISLAYADLFINYVRAFVFRARAIAVAQAAGDRKRLAIGLSMQGFVDSALLGTERGEARFAEARALLKDDDHWGLGILLQNRGWARLHVFDWKGVLEEIGQARQHLSKVADAYAEHTLATLLELVSLNHLGRFNAFAESVTACIEDARARGDRTNEVIFRVGFPFSLHLIRDEPDQEAANLERAASLWAGRGGPMGLFMALCQASLELYVGQPAQALKRLVSARRDSPFLGPHRIPGNAIWLYNLTSSAASKVFAQTGDPAALRILRRQTRGLGRLPRVLSQVYVEANEGCLQLLLGAREPAIAHLDHVIAGTSQANWPVSTCVYRLVRAQVRQDEREIADCIESLKVMGVVNPARFANVWFTVPPPDSSDPAQMAAPA